MSIADNFATDYINTIQNHRKTEVENIIFAVYDTNDIHDVIVRLYWEISNKYDRMNHRPVPSNVYMKMTVSYNFNNMCKHILENDDLYGAFNLQESISLAIDNVMNVKICPDDHDGCNCDSHWI